MQKRLYRSRKDQKISGVCGGIAEYFEIDATIIRLIWLVSIFAFGTGLLVYIIASLIIPEEDYGDSTINLNKDSDGVYQQERNIDAEKNKQFFGYALIVVGALLFIKRFPLFHFISFRTLFPIVLIGAGIAILGKTIKNR